MSSRFPPLYECSECHAAVKVTPRDGAEPLIVRRCEHASPIWANRKVTLRGKGALEAMPPARRAGIRLVLTVRQLLSALTGRSI